MDRRVNVLYLPFVDVGGEADTTDDGGADEPTPEPRKDFPETWLWDIITTKYGPFRIYNPVNHDPFVYICIYL